MNLALKLFNNNKAAAIFWFVLFMLTFCASLVQNAYIVHVLKKDEKVLVFDSAGVFHLAPAQTFDKARELKRHAAWLGVKSLFDRNPTGFDNPDLLKQLFLPDAMKQIEADFEGSRKMFADRKIHQKAEITKQGFLEKENYVLAQMDVVLHMTGDFGGREIAHTRKEQVTLHMFRNRNFGTNRYLPSAINKIERKEIK